MTPRGRELVLRELEREPALVRALQVLERQWELVKELGEGRTLM
jgi:hypothetical protein